MNRLIDAHLHLNTNSPTPLSELLAQMKRSSIERGVLIVNTEAERDLLMNEKELLDTADHIKLIAGLNIHWKDPYAIINSLSSFRHLCGIKLHPLLYGYERLDFDAICSAIQASGSKALKNIVIDTLFNDEHVENHVGIELGICVSRAFPEKNVILAHCGSTRLLECCAFTRRIPYIFYDLSFVAAYFNHTSLRLDMMNYLKHTSNRMMFGSDYPSFEIKRAVRSLREICEEACLNEADMNDVFCATALKVYFPEETA